MSIVQHIKEHSKLGFVIPGTTAESLGAAAGGSAAANAAAIQSALDVAGYVSLTTQGIYEINKTLFIGSDTHFYVGPGVTLKLADSADCLMLRNKASAIPVRNTAFVRASNVVTVTEPGHIREVGDYVLIASPTSVDATYVGEYTVASVNGETWTYAAAGANGSPTLFLWVYANYERLVYSAFSGNGTTVTVTEAGHLRRVGDPVYIVGVTPTSGAFNGLYEITSTTSSTWTYLADGQTPTAGTAKVFGDRNITVTIDGTMDANRDNNAAYQINGSVLYFMGIGGLHVSGTVVNSEFRGTTVAACTDVYIKQFKALNTLVAVQVESFWNRAHIEDITHQGTDDCVAFTMTDPNIGGGGGVADYATTACPFGLRNSDNASSKNIRGISSLCMVKITCAQGYNVGNIAFYGIYGTVTAAPISIIDDYLQWGGSAGSISIKNVDVEQQTTEPLFYYDLSGTVQSLLIEDVVVHPCAGFGLIQAHSTEGASTPGTIKELTVRGVSLDSSGNGVATTNWITVGGGTVAGFTIENLNIERGTVRLYTGAALLRLGDTTTTVTQARIALDKITSTGDRNSPIVHQGVGKMRRVLFEDMYGYGLGNLFKNSATATAVESAVGVTVNIADVYLDHCAAPVNAEANLKYTQIVNGLRYAGTTSAYLNGSTAGTHRVKVNGLSRVNESDNAEWGIGTTDAAAFYVGNGSTSTAVFSIDGKEATLDVGAYGGAGNNTLTPKDGDVVYNTNAALGTLGVDGPVIRSSTTGAAHWHLLADPTKFY